MKLDRLEDGTVIAVPDNGNLGFAARIDDHFGVRFERQLGLQTTDKEPLSAPSDEVLAGLFARHVKAVPTPEQPGRQSFINGVLGVVGVQVAGMSEPMPKLVTEVEEFGPPVQVYEMMRQRLIDQGVPDSMLGQIMDRIRLENWSNFLGNQPPRDYDF